MSENVKADEYRESGDEEPEEAEETEAAGEATEEGEPEKAEATEEGEPSVKDWFEPRETEGDEEQEEFYTAVMIVMRHDGLVMPMTKLGGVPMHHEASPHEVLRMCADVQDQISTVRIVGEILQNVHKMIGGQTQELANMLMQLVGGPKGPKTSSAVRSKARIIGGRGRN